MYGYVDNYIPLTIENVLSRISQESIFSLLLGETPEINKLYFSLVREDKTPGCEFMWYGNKLIFIDFGYHKQHLDCFGVISERENINLNDTLYIINKHFKLGLNGTGTPLPIRYNIVHAKTIKKESTKIIFKPRKFNLHDKKYWTDYGITKENLIEDRVHAVLWYKFYSNKLQKTITIRPNTISYAYHEFSPRVKIYSPFKDKRKGKFITNTITNDIGGLTSYKSFTKRLIITKSYKDYRCIKNFGINTIWFQAEGVIPDAEILIPLIDAHEEFIVIYDNDTTGISTSTNLTAVLNSHFPGKARNVTVPRHPKS